MKNKVMLAAAEMFKDVLTKEQIQLLRVRLLAISPNSTLGDLFRILDWAARLKKEDEHATR